MFYMTKLGWPVKFVEIESSWGDKVPYIYFSDSVSIRSYTGDCIFSRQESFNYVEGWDVPFKEFCKNFFTLYGGRKAYFKGKLYYDFFELPLSSDRVYLYTYFTGSSFYFGKEYLTDLHGNTKIPYSDLRSEDDLVGVGDFTYKDVRYFYDIHLAEFFQLTVADKLFHRVQLYEPRVSSKYQGKISLYMNHKDKARDRLTALRPGRAFKLMFPELPDPKIAELVDKFNISYPIVELSLHTGREEGDFIKAYSYEQSVMQNVVTTTSRKSLANSCMRLRAEFEGLPKHPSAAYASGEFLSVWTEDNKGGIASRCVLWWKEGETPQAGPVYGTSEQSIDVIEEYLLSINAKLYDEATWVGAKLLYIPCNGGALAPYLDHEKGLSISSCEEFLVVCSGDEGDFVAETYSGVLSHRSQHYCEACGDSVDEVDVFSSPDGECYCEYCYNERFTTCYEDDYEVYSREDMDLCRVGKLRWGWHEELVYNPAQHDYQHIYGHWYHPDLCVTTEQGDVFVKGDEGYFICEMTSTPNNIDQLVSLPDYPNMSISKEWAEDNCYILNEDGQYFKPEEQEAA